jgi:hypothetical protein
MFFGLKRPDAQKGPLISAPPCGGSTKQHIKLAAYVTKLGNMSQKVQLWINLIHQSQQQQDQLSQRSTIRCPQAETDIQTVS